MHPRIQQSAFGIAGAFTGFSATWAAWGLATPGDYFANGSLWLYPSLVLFLVVGAVAGWLSAGKKFRYAWLALLILATVFWVFVPMGWWAYEPSFS